MAVLRLFVQHIKSVSLIFIEFAYFASVFKDKRCVISIFWGEKLTTKLPIEMKTVKMRHEYITPSRDNHTLQDLKGGLVTMINNANNNNISAFNHYYFYGIAQIPFIFRLGMQYGNNSKNYALAHYFKRDSFSKLKILRWGRKTESLKVSFADKKSQDLVVSIATSFPMDDISNDILFRDKSILSIESTTNNVDIISNQSIMNQWADQISREIRKYVKEYSIKKVHLLLNTSSEMVFKLGTMFANNYDPDMNIYHYSLKDKIKRPWYLDTKKDTIEKTRLEPQNN